MKRHIIKRTLSVLSMLFVAGLSHAQTSTENYVQTTTCLDADCVKKSETVQYFDYLGRPKQVISVKSSPTGKDVVAHVEYDALGRQTKSYLPVPQSGTQNGEIYSSPLGNASAIYGGEKIYSESFLENSPLQRVQQQVRVGNDWANKPVNFAYDVNTTADAVKKFTPTTVWENEATKTTFTDSEVYTNGQLTKNSVKDEDGNETIVFKDGRGQTILSRKMLNATQKADTYYIYNEYGGLAYVIPPLASASAITSIVLDNLCYQYKYDSRSNLVEKKLPGKGWEYMIYDKQDRLVATQDTELKNKGHWLYTKYDQFGRVAITGIGTGLERLTEQNMVDGLGSNNVNRVVTAPFNRQGVDVYYGNQDSTYPNSSKWVTLLSLNYYDTYPNYSFNPAFPSSIINQAVLTDNPATDGKSTKGLPVISLVKNVEDDNWTKSFNYYDKKGRAIGTYAINHLGGYTKTESELDFAGATKQTKVYHKRLNTDTEKVITQTYTYDSQNRLLVHKHKVDNNTEEILTQNEYNELSQIKNKKVGGTDIANPLQSIDYKYNIRGWLTKINDPVDLNGKLFGYEMRYNNPMNPNIASGKFNGNIAEVDWKNASEDVLKRYDYTYDKLNRLQDAVYSEPNSTTPFNNNFNESLTYDLNGNISTLKRNAFPVSGNTSTLVDDLIYEYTGNRLTKVRETALNNTGYEGGNNVIAYDLNGNMTDMKDKGIQAINYNFLNLSNRLYIKQINPLGKVSNTNISYLYRADGTKLRKTYNNSGDMGSMTTRITDYLDGFQYSYYDDGFGGVCMTCKTEVAYEEQAYQKIIGGPVLPATPEWKLSFVPTAEGFYSFTENRYIYQYKDHLGNARVSFAKNSAGVLQATDTNNLYPFGLNHIGGSLPSNFGSYYSYKYNGKELQETGFYDYGWRQYMPDLGKWNGMDQLSEKYLSTSPYAYVANNSVKYADIDGRWFAEDGSIINTSGQTYGFLGSSHKPSYATNYLGQGLGDTRGYTPFGETKAYATLMDAYYKGATSNMNGVLSWWTNADGAQYGQYNMMKFATSSDNWWQDGTYDAIGKFTSYIASLIGSTNEEFPQITNTGGLARTDFDASTWKKFRPGDKLFTLDAGSFVFPSTFPADGSKRIATWAGRLYAVAWSVDRLADVKNILSGGKVIDTAYFRGYTFDKNGIKDTLYQTPVKSGETWESAYDRVYKISKETLRSKW
ncbi:DUF6443 domain-containing protein [Chryseobacterium polytrichastri]|uniref:RHS repeat-associated core domain-containing protein n=1 Tax=Chryseobacterium polytrichastri TaxID=1302687 RepID=A0A1M6TAG6_9FLAO|nr:DUF6443 domain-containing protein [Chryseobacterium polytrichastri]SHK53967.1 RHS repeat-associated core domain-containing protein [Chryseobacterium polytrichastri]